MADEERPDGAEEPQGAQDTPETVDDAEQTPAEPAHAPEQAAAPVAQPVAAEEPAAAAEEEQPAEQTPAEQPAAVEEPATAPASEGAADEIEDDEEEEPAPREKPAVPGAHLEVDIVPEGVDPLSRGSEYQDSYEVDPYATDDEVEDAQDGEEDREAVLAQPISTAAIDLASGARYRATGKRKSAIARVTLRPGTGTYLVNGRTLEEHFPRLTLQRNIRQPLETVGYQDRMDVVARLHGGGISAQAGALRHGVSRALLEADPNLRGELKRRGFLTRDSRAKERKKAGLKKARKRPQFSKR
jgi:small subunit ribosomal protein S9